MTPFLSNFQSALVHWDASKVVAFLGVGKVHFSKGKGMTTGGVGRALSFRFQLEPASDHPTFLPVRGSFAGRRLFNV